jgi:hypothetical protein
MTNPENDENSENLENPRMAISKRQNAARRDPQSSG